jgi:hypothetical protein
LERRDRGGEAALLGEIKDAEERRASALEANPELEAWTKRVRQKFVVNGFLMPFYSWDGRRSRSLKRIQELGNYILPDEFVGHVFYKEAEHSWVLQESMWFWEYLSYGQEAILRGGPSSLPQECKIEGIPAHAIWKDLTELCSNLHCHGEEGGGLILVPNMANTEWLTGTREGGSHVEGDDGYLEPYSVPRTLRWIELFQLFDELEALQLPLEVCPPWFHIARLTFFNVPIRRLPVFYSAFTSESKVSKIVYLDDGLSDPTRELISRSLFAVATDLRRTLYDKEWQRKTLMTKCWLWRYVGSREHKRVLSYGEIANLTRKPRSSIQAMVERFHQKLEEGLDARLLGVILRTSEELGLGANLTYGVLFKLGFVPERKRGIDSFDDLYKLM